MHFLVARVTEWTSFRLLVRQSVSRSMYWQARSHRHIDIALGDSANDGRGEHRIYPWEAPANVTKREM